MVFAGDLFDFLQVTTVPDVEPGLVRNTSREVTYGLGTLPDQTIWKLEQRISPGHWRFFESLSRFLADGHDVVVIAGNHDIELVDPQVRRALRGILLKSKKRRYHHISGSIDFSPWFYYEPGLIFVEHGHQYDPLNSFDYLLYPRRPDGTFELPAGSFFVRYLFNQVEARYPFADNMKPASRFLRWYLKKHWHQLLGMKRYLVGVCELLKKASPIEQDLELAAQSEQERRIKVLVKETGARLDQLLRLKALWARSVVHEKTPRVELLRKMKLFLRFCGRAEGLDLRHIARQIHQILGVQYVVLGHTHQADLAQIGLPNGRLAEYFNTGTWTKCFAENYADALLKSENEFAFCHYNRNAKKMHLLRWNNDRGEPERVKLFQERSD